MDILSSVQRSLFWIHMTVGGIREYLLVTKVDTTSLWYAQVLFVPGLESSELVGVSSHHKRSHWIRNIHTDKWTGIPNPLLFEAAVVAVNDTHKFTAETWHNYVYLQELPSRAQKLTFQWLLLHRKSSRNTIISRTFQDFTPIVIWKESV